MSAPTCRTPFRYQRSSAMILSPADTSESWTRNLRVAVVRVTRQQICMHPPDTPSPIIVQDGRDEEAPVDWRRVAMERSQNPKYSPHRPWGAEKLYRISRRLWVKGWRLPALAVKYVNVLAFRCYIDPAAVIGHRLDLPHGGFGVVIGGAVHIGSDAIIFHEVTLGSAKPGPIHIGDRVYVGAGARILGPIRIGDDVRIGANAVVVGFDVPDGATVVGPEYRLLPAKVRVDKDSAFGPA